MAESTEPNVGLVVGDIDGAVDPAELLKLSRQTRQEQRGTIARYLAALDLVDDYEEKEASLHAKQLAERQELAKRQDEEEAALAEDARLSLRNLGGPAVTATATPIANESLPPSLTEPNTTEMQEDADASSMQNLEDEDTAVTPVSTSDDAMESKPDKSTERNHALLIAKKEQRAHKISGVLHQIGVPGEVIGTKMIYKKMVEMGLSISTEGARKMFGAASDDLRGLGVEKVGHGKYRVSRLEQVTDEEMVVGKDSDQTLTSDEDRLSTLELANDKATSVIGIAINISETVDRGRFNQLLLARAMVDEGLSKNRSTAKQYLYDHRGKLEELGLTRSKEGSTVLIEQSAFDGAQEAADEEPESPVLTQENRGSSAINEIIVQIIRDLDTGEGVRTDVLAKSLVTAGLYATEGTSLSMLSYRKKALEKLGVVKLRQGVYSFKDASIAYETSEAAESPAINEPQDLEEGSIVDITMTDSSEEEVVDFSECILVQVISDLCQIDDTVTLQALADVLIDKGFFNFPVEAKKAIGLLLNESTRIEPVKERGAIRLIESEGRPKEVEQVAEPNKHQKVILKRLLAGLDLDQDAAKELVLAGYINEDQDLTDAGYDALRARF